MKLSLLIKECGLDASRTKLTRHPLNNPDVKKCYDLGFLETHQAEQRKPIFNDCDYILTFLGKSGTNAEFFGCYHVDGVVPLSPDLAPSNYPFPQCFEIPGNYYLLSPSDILSEFKERLLINWGGSTVSWNQWANRNDKEILAIYPDSGIKQVRDFNSYEETVLTFKEVETIVGDTVLYSEWHSVLSAVNGIYLIVDTADGKQYVGSTYNKDGILGRWRNYADTHHGGDLGIVELLNERPEAYQQFQFSILRVLPKTVLAEDAIRIESLYKRNLYTLKPFGLNYN